MLLTSILRTIVPALWGSFIAWLIGLLPILAPLETDLAGLADVALPVITAVIIGAWYALWRWLEPRLPDWLTRAVLGSAKTPVYPGKHAAAAGSIVQGTLAATRITEGKLGIYDTRERRIK